MFIKINQDNEIVDNSENFIELDSNGDRLLIFGNFISLFQNKKFLSKNESIEIFKISLNNISQLEKNIRETIGSCQFILKKKNEDKEFLIQMKVLDYFMELNITFYM